MKVAVAQAGSAMFDTSATLARIEALCREAAEQGAKLLVFPEAMLGGYPKAQTFGATVGNRTPEGRDLYLRYAKSAIACPGDETAHLAGLARELDLTIVTGAIEREGGTLYCSALVFTPADGFVHKHRKLMPTASERVIWGLGDGSDLHVVPTPVGRLAVAICWENYMPLYRQHLIAQQVEIWCAPTVDAREMWRNSMRHIAYEARCFVLSACQKLETADWPDDMKQNGGTIDGGSVIVSPMGELLAGPQGAKGILYADIDLDDLLRAKFDLDLAGHYSRPDVFHFSVAD